VGAAAGSGRGEGERAPSRFRADALPLLGYQLMIIGVSVKLGKNKKLIY
jgi:hypothetical protein